MCAAKRHVCFTPNSDRESEIPQNVMSALPPKADMCGAARDVCFGPKVDTCIAANCALFDHGICLHQNSGRNRETQNFGAPDVDNEL